MRRGFPRAGVPDELDMLAFGPLRNPKHLLRLVRFEADAIAFHGLVELLRGQQVPDLSAGVHTSSPCAA